MIIETEFRYEDKTEKNIKEMNEARKSEGSRSCKKRI